MKRTLQYILILSGLVLAYPARTQVVPPLEVSTQANDLVVSLNYNNVPLEMALDQYSEITGRTIIPAPGINASITLPYRTDLTRTEALIAIESALRLNNIGLVPLGDKFLKVVPIAELRTQGAAISTALDEDPLTESDRSLTQVIELKYMELTEVQPILEQLKHSSGKIIPLPNSNSLMVTDAEQNVKRMLELVAVIDRPIDIKEDIFVREITHAKASEIAGMLNELIADSQAEAEQQSRQRAVAAAPTPRTSTRAQTPAGVIRAQRQPASSVSAAAMLTATELAQRGIVQGKVKIVADDRTNIMFIISQPENFEFFDRIIDVLDRAVDPSFQVEVVAMEYADSEEVAGILNDFIGAASSDEDDVKEVGSSSRDDLSNSDSRSRALRDFIQNQDRTAASRTVSRSRSAQDQAAALEEADAFGRLSPLTKILADARTNSLLLMGRKQDLSALREIIEQLDIMLGQVLIEVVILEVRLGEDLSYGVDWLQRSFTVYNEESVGPNGGIGVQQPVMSFGGGQRVLGSDAPFIDASTLARTTPIGGALTYYTTLFDLNIDAVINLAAASSDARILSTPVVMTTDNTEAKVSIGEERPVVTTSSTTTAGSIRSSYEYKNIGINLTVTPRINPERFVVMEIQQTADGVAGSVEIDGNEVPIITKRDFSASVAVDSRQTIVLGGLVGTDNSFSRTKVPLLGDIPILGTLFRSDSRNDVRTELLVLITPYVMMNQAETRAETERLYEATHRGAPTLQRGWSDSPLAEERRDQSLHKKQRTDKKRKESVEPSPAATPRAKLTPGIYISTPDDSAGRGPQTQEIPESLLNAVSIPMPDSPDTGQEPVIQEEVEQDTGVSLRVLPAPTGPEPTVEEPTVEEPPMEEQAVEEPTETAPAVTETIESPESLPEATPVTVPAGKTGAAIVESPASTTPKALGFLEELRRATEEAQKREEAAAREPAPAVTIPGPPAP